MASRERLDGLTALRGWAAVAVLILHFLAIPNLDAPDSIVFVKAYFHMGVTLFFVISAFSLCLSTTPRLNQPGWLAAFAIRRFMRIAPLFYAMTLFYLIGVPLIVGGPFPFSKVFETVTFIFGLMPGDPSLVWAGWTIGAEMLFYVLLPFALVLVRGLGGSLLLYFLSLGASVSFVNYFDSIGSPETYAKLSIFGSFGIFAVGIVMYHAFQNENVRQGRVFWGWLSAVAAVCLGVLLAVNNISFFYTDAAILRNLGLTKELSWAPVFGLIVISQALRPMSLITNRLFVHLGDLSFSIYLCHPPIVYFLKPVYEAIYAAAPGAWSALFACAAVTFSIVYIVSSITFRIIERPGIALGEQMIQRRVSHSQGREAPKVAGYGR